MPGRQDVDRLLAPGRLIVRGTDADLAAVVLRLLRKTMLASVELGYVPVAESAATRLWGLPVGDAALDLALRGTAGSAPLIRDDAGGVLVASGRIEPIKGRVYCDDAEILNGSARSLEVVPDPDATPLPTTTADPLSEPLEPAVDGLRVTMVSRDVLRRRSETFRGRAVQASFRSATVVCDGIAHPRPAERWVWYRHTEDLRLLR